MKILIFYQYFGTPKGRWSTRMYEMTKRWVEAGHKVTVVTSPYEKSDIRASQFIERQTVEGIELIVINCADSNRDSTAKRIFKALCFSLFSCYFALTEKFDIVLASSGPISVGLPALLAKWLRGKKMVFEVRDLWPEGAIQLGKLNNRLFQNIARKFERACYKNSSLVVPCSKGMEEGVKLSYPNARTLVIPNASDVELFGNVLVEEDFAKEYRNKKVFLYAGSLGLMDEVVQVLEGMKQLTDPNIQLIIIGDGADRSHLEKFVKENRLESVHFLGLIPKTEVVKWFSISEASFVTFKDIPVLHTSSPNKMFDSFAAGVPIIQSTKGWIKQLVDEKQCGINVRPDAPQDFAEAFVAIAYDKDYRDRLGENAKMLSLNEFNRTKLARTYLDHLEKL